MATEGGEPEKESGTPELENYSQFLVLGGGIAGLSAASHLAKNGFKDFKLLEARNRLGGRIATMQMGGSKVELGAHWIHVSWATLCTSWLYPTD